MEIDLLQLSKDYGPAALSVVGSLVLAAFGLASTVARWAWKKHEKRMGQMAQAIQNLAKSLEASTKDHHNEHATLWKSVHGLRADLQATTQRIDPVAKELLEVQGSIKTLNQSIMNYAEKMAAVSGKLDAVFRFMDAPKRASDG
jgi:uncharacterized protein YoxC